MNDKNKVQFGLKLFILGFYVASLLLLSFTVLMHLYEYVDGDLWEFANQIPIGKPQYRAWQNIAIFALLGGVLPYALMRLSLKIGYNNTWYKPPFHADHSWQETITRTLYELGGMVTCFLLYIFLIATIL